VTGGDPKVFVALDIDEPFEAQAVADSLSGLGLGFKLGPRLLLRDGMALVRAIAKYGQVFVDCKHFDIPSTMESAVRAAFEAGASYTTIHTLAGPQAVKKMSELESQLKLERHFRILAVTLLTSFSQDTLPIHLKQSRIERLVEALALESRDNGINSFVCSPHEAKQLREIIPDCFLVTPGIRPSGLSKGDQVRVETPQAAKLAGSSALVVGRPILEATDRRAMAEKILADFT
jgi:orotidine-5'-phosphate decarboxylase